MTQCEKLLALFQSHDNVLTRAQIEDQEWMCNRTGRISDLRKSLRLRGGDITCEEHPENPMANIYRLVLPPANLADVEFKEEGGQLTIAIKERAA